MTGAVKMHFLTKRSGCKYPKRLGAVVNDYIAFTEKGSFFGEEATNTVYLMLEACYCGRNQDMS